MIKKLGSAAFLYGVFVGLTALGRGLSPAVALGRGAFSGLVLFIAVVLFHLGWKALSSEEERKEDASADRSRPDLQIEYDLIEKLKNDPARGAELIKKISGEPQVRE